MKSVEEVIEFVAKRIGHIYHRALMYGGTPGGVDLILHYCHELWAEIVERQQEYWDTSMRVHEEQDCGAFDFSGRFRKVHPEATDEETVGYVVRQWRKISDQLGVPIPYDEIIQDLERAFEPEDD